MSYFFAKVCNFSNTYIDSKESIFNKALCNIDFFQNYSYPQFVQKNLNANCLFYAESLPTERAPTQAVLAVVILWMFSTDLIPTE